MSNDFKPCPFCGEDDCLFWVSGIGAGSNCLTRGGKDVRAAWNIRPLEDALRARAEKAEADERDCSTWKALVKSNKVAYDVAISRAEEAENKARALEHELADRTISFMGRPIEYWVKLDAYSRANMYDKLIEEIVNLRSNKVDTNGEQKPTKNAEAEVEEWRNMASELAKQYEASRRWINGMLGIDHYSPDEILLAFMKRRDEE